MAKKKQEKLNIRGEAPVILQVLPAMESGGVERGTAEIARAARDAGFTSIVASEGGKYAEELHKDNIRQVRLPLASKNIFTIWRNIKELKKVIDEHRVDIVHARSRAPAWSAYYAAKKGGAHFVTTFHGTYSMRGLFKRWYNSIMTKGEKVIAISNYINDYIKEFYELEKEKIEIIHRGVDLEYFDPKSVDKERVAQIERALRTHKDFPVILVPARISEWKGQDFVLKALTKLKTHEYTCMFVGKHKRYSKYLEKLKDYKVKHGLRGNVNIIDPVDDMPAAYKRADIVISPATKPEAFGRVAIEAQAMGAMLIATDLGGSKETVIDGETGFLVQPDDEETLAKKIEELLELDGNERRKIGNAARKHVKKNFSLEKMTEATLDIYRGVLKE